MATHVLDDTSAHTFWDNSHPPRVRIEPGDTVVFETLEASARQITPESISTDLANVTFDPIHPLTGPVFVEGAKPGDTLEVEILSLEHRGWGWSAVRPGFGILADEFPAPYLHHYRIERSTCYFNEHIAIPYQPFCGAMGLAPAQAGRFDSTPPRSTGGRIDFRQLIPGARVAFQVVARGALFSCGSCTPAQGKAMGPGIDLLNQRSDGAGYEALLISSASLFLAGAFLLMPLKVETPITTSPAQSPEDAG